MANTTRTPSSTASTRADVQTALGKTVISDGVIAKIAGIAAREARGVFALGGGAARALGAIRNTVGSTDYSQGISVEVGETQVAVDVTVVADYPTPLQRVATDVRDSVTAAIVSLVGMEVTEVNVTIADVHLPSDDKDEEESRVK